MLRPGSSTRTRKPAATNDEHIRYRSGFKSADAPKVDCLGQRHYCRTDQRCCERPRRFGSAALVGVNPVYGLYTSVAAPIGGSLPVSTQLMQIATTSASALAAGQGIASYPLGQRDQALFLLVLLTGVFLVMFGVLRLGRLVRFVSHAVMIGLLSGVAVVLILDQLAPLLGLNPRGSNEVAQFLDILVHIGQLSVPTLLIGLLALAIPVGLQRTRLSIFSSLMAIIVPSVIVALLGLESVQRVVDVSSVPRGLSILTLLDLTLLTSPGSGGVCDCGGDRDPGRRGEPERRES